MSLILRPFYIVRLIALFLYDLTVSSVQVARAVLSPRDVTRPRFVVVPLTRAETDAEITLVGNYITLTPGTLTVDVSADRRSLLIHSLLAGDSGDGVRADVRDAIEPRVIKATRG
jgi:multicomponent Na+:H+ antiporter subunit E